MTLSELCIRRPVLTTLLTVSFIVVGVFAYRLLPISALPRVDFATIQITANLPEGEAEDHGGDGRLADRGAVVDHRRHHLVDFAVLPGVGAILRSNSTSAVTSMRPRLTSRRR